MVSLRTLSLASLLLAPSVLVGCGEPSAPDAAPSEDAPSPEDAPEPDLLLDAPPDPAEVRACATERPAAGAVRAKHVVCEEELLDGALAMGRVGDVVLENAVARFVIRTGEGSATTLGGPAGGLLDAAAVGGVDQVKEIFPLFDLASLAPSEVVVVDAGGSGEARVRVLFDAAPLGLVETVVPGLGGPADVRGQLDYVLSADARVLRMELAITTNEGLASTLVRTGALALLGGGAEHVLPGVGVLDADRLGGAGPRLVAERADGALALELVGSTDATWTRIDTIHLVRGRRLAVSRGALTRFELRVSVGDVAATALDALARSDDGVRPLVIHAPPGDRVEISEGESILVRSRVPDGGAITWSLPPGTYALRSGFGAVFEGTPTSFVHDGSREARLEAAPRATLRVVPTVDGEAGVPVRVTVERAGDELARFVALGDTTRPLPPGPARVTVSHGLEHDVIVEDVVLVAGAEQRLDAPIVRALDTSGWVSVDLHLHSELSTDSTHRLEDALRMMAAEDVEVVSSTDHDFVNEHARHAARAGVEGRVLLVSGEEVSTTVFGHVNGYPLRPDLTQTAAGAVAWFGRSPSEIFAGLRARGDASLGGALVQLNHPRLERGFFDAVALDPETGHATASPASLDLGPEVDLDDFAFDVIEVWNGYTRGDNEASFADYLALLAAGRRFTMVGNSDTHRPTLPAGSPRSFVRVPDDTRGAYGWPEVATSLRAADVTVAGGIFVVAELAGPASAGVVPVHVRVQAAPWVDVDRLRVYAGRGVVLDRPIAPSAEVVRLEETIDVPHGEADFVVVRADGSRAPEPVQHFAPYGVTNALWVP